MIYSLNSSINVLKYNLSQAKIEGYDFTNIDRMLELALTSFNAGEYDKAQSRVSDAQKSFEFQKSLEDSKLINVLKRFVVDYWPYLIVTVIVLFALSIAIYRKVAVHKIHSKLEALTAEEASIHEAIKLLQQEYFIEKSLGSEQYSSQNDSYQKRLSDISELRIKYNNIKLSSTSLFGMTEDIHSQHKEILSMIKKLQDDYFVHRTIDKKKYNSTYSEYKKRLAALDKQAATEVAKEATKNAMRNANRLSTSIDSSNGTNLNNFNNKGATSVNSQNNSQNADDVKIHDMVQANAQNTASNNAQNGKH
jgi:hypothetical protein